MSDAATIASLTPPGHFMCCICFEMFPETEAATDSEGDKVNVCVNDREAAGL